MEIVFMAVLVVVIIAASYATKQMLARAASRVGRAQMVAALERVSRQKQSLEAKKSEMTPTDYAIQMLRIERHQAELVSWM